MLWQNFLGFAFRYIIGVACTVIAEASVDSNILMGMFADVGVHM